MKRIYKFSFALVLLSSLNFQVACDRTYEPGTVTEKRVKIAESKKFYEYPVSSLTPGDLEGIAYEHQRRGDSEMYLTVTYDPHSANATAMNATQAAAAISKDLKGMGVSAKTDILPVTGSRELKALFSYNALEAVAPDCELMPGLEDRDHKTSLDYRMGCSVETMIARQISRPGDLRGRAPASLNKDGRGVSNQIDVVRSGARNESLGGESATE